MSSTHNPMRKRVALIGRPNVGKSSLFNKLTRTRKAVVRNEPGVTRDIQVEPAEWWGSEFDVIDTGGLTEDKAGFSPLIREQVLEILGSVDMLVVVMDARAGLCPEDRDVFRIAKATGKPTLVVVNKVDQTTQAELAIAEFHEFAVPIVAAAFEQDFGIDVIVEWVRSHLQDNKATYREGYRVAIIGKPNAGKSSLCNCLLAERRMLVSDIAGTTVDAVEAQFFINDKPYILVDTAGLRRKSHRDEGVEVLSSFKTRDSIASADVVLLVVDGVQGLTIQDTRIAEMCLDQHKPIILVVNKYDLSKQTRENYREWFREQIDYMFHFHNQVPVCFVSAKTGFGLKDLKERIAKVQEQMGIRISTSQLNKFFVETIKQAPAPVYGTTNVKFYYLTQTHQVPPSFIAFANHPEGVTPAYRRFLARKIQEHWDLQGIPVRIFVLPSGSKNSTASERVNAHH